MPRSYPDWSNVRREVSYILREDLAELAARLGSVDVYDRRGSVVWWDNFAQGIEAWTTATAGTGAAVALSTTTPHWPPFCVRLTAGSTGGRYAGIGRNLAPMVSERIGLEITVGFATLFDVFDLYLIHQYVESATRSVVRLSYTDQKVYCADENSVFQEIGDLPTILWAEFCYHNLKLVVDFSAGKYVRLLLDDVLYDLSAYGLEVTADVYYDHIDCAFYHYARAGQNDYCLIGSVIVTQDEP